MGVEPTKDCTTALPGFEVRTSRRGAKLFLMKHLPLLQKDRYFLEFYDLFPILSCHAYS